MSTMRNWIITGAAAMALAVPLVGAAEARSDRDYGGKKSHELRHKGFKPHAHHRKGRRVARFGSIATPKIRRRIANQMRRIRRGRITGRLSRFEGLRLRGHLFSINSTLQFAKLDGRVTHRERRRLHRKLDANSKRIRRFARFTGRSHRVR